MVRIIRQGAKIGYTGPPRFSISKNHLSASEASFILTTDIEKQLAAGHLITLSSTLPDPYKCSPPDLVPKSSGGWSRIHDLSFSEGALPNEIIPRIWGALEYATFDEAVELLLIQGRGTILLIEDLADAFRHVPVAMQDRWLLGFQWQDVFYVKAFLPFGLRTAVLPIRPLPQGRSLHPGLRPRLEPSYTLPGRFLHRVAS